MSSRSQRFYNDIVNKYVTSLKTAAKETRTGRDNEQTDDNYMLEETILHNAGVLQALISP